MSEWKLPDYYPEYGRPAGSLWGRTREPMHPKIATGPLGRMIAVASCTIGTTGRKDDF
jgi:hypothetical protein